ncbi:MAG TPA: 6-phosphofructokinase [Tepidisphaeraceae bacterium]|nr:6-phosphofructokinase [Tepidisphaeraceae bacterium]
MSTLKGNAVVGQSGGPTNVINQSLVGVIQNIKANPNIDKLLGCKHGVKGVINDDYVQLNNVPDELLERIARTPSSALGSTRDKPDEAYCKKIFENFQKNNVRYFFYIGGNDSADTARIVGEMGIKAGHELHVFHIPKTIDNDLRVHDHTPGYGSAAKFVAQAMMGDNYDNKSLPGIKVNVIMGRHAGFLTAASALARKYENDGPHLIYIPEAGVSEEKFLADVDAVYKKLGRCLIAVSEGMATPDGKTYAEKIASNVEKDSHGNIQLSGTGALGDYLSGLITKNLTPAGGKKLRVRADTFGYLQRSFAGIISEVDAKEARTVGRKAVDYSADQKNIEGSVCMTRKTGSSYAVDLHLESIKNVARETKHMPKEFIQNGNDVTQAFLDYARPLVGDLPTVGSFAELNK